MVFNSLSDHQIGASMSNKWSSKFSQKWLSLAVTVFILVWISSGVFAQEKLSEQEIDYLDEVVIVSSRYPVPLSEVVGSVASISGEDISSRMVNDLQDLLATTVGVSVNRRQAYGRTYNDGVSIRGLGGKRVNILIDGIRVADAYTGYGRDVVDMGLLKRVEILKGPSSALYGSDGLAGVVSYITKDPEDLALEGSPYLSVSAQYDSSSSRTNVGILGATTGHDLDTLVQITKHQMNETELHNGALLTPNPMNGDQESLFAKFKYRISEMSELTFTADVQRWQGDWDLQTDIGMSFFPAIVNTSESLGTDKGNRDRFSLDYSFDNNTVWTDQGKISFYTQSTDQSQITNEQTQTFGGGLNVGPTALTAIFADYQFNQSIKGISIEMFKRIESSAKTSHQIVYGAELEYIDVQRPRYKTATDPITEVSTSVFGADIFPNKTFPDTQTKRTGVFINDRIELTDRATMVIGLRYDQYELTPRTDKLFNNSNAAQNSLANIDDGALSSKFGFLYDISNDISVFTQYAEGFRSPDYESANLTFTNFAYFYSVAPNPDLESEESAGFEIGLRGNHTDLKWSLAAYQTDYEKFIETDLTGATPRGISIYQYVNKSDVTIKGLEFEMQKKLSDNFAAILSANRTYGESAGAKLLSINPSEGVLSIRWRSDDGHLSVRGITTMVASGPSDLAPSCGRGGCNPALELPGRVTYDIFVDYQLTENMSTKFAIANMTDVKYWDWSSVDGKLASDANLDLFLETGREFRVDLKYTF
jgi:hemoglobin/transferrin/lactoferrin receptor protein